MEIILTKTTKLVVKWNWTWLKPLLNMVGGRGLEPLTSAMSTRRSNQLS